MNIQDKPNKSHSKSSRRKLLSILCPAALLVLVIVAGLLFSGKDRRRLTEETDMSQSETQVSDESAEAAFEALEGEIASQKINMDELLNSYGDLGIVRVSGYINMRSKPDVNDMTNIIGMLTDGAAMSILGETDGWASVASGGLTGYVNSRYLITGGEAKEQASDLAAERAVIRVPTLNIRSSPEVAPDNIIGRARKNERYLVVQIQNEWALVETDSATDTETGYINIANGNAEIRLCLNEARKLDLREMVLTQYDNIVVSNTKGYVNIRKTPEDKGIDNICGKFMQFDGAELMEVIENAGRTWYRIQSGKVNGYVCAEFCATGDEAKRLAVDHAVLTAQVKTEALNVRSEPSTESKVWTQIVKGQAYPVLGQMDGWVEIDLGSISDLDETDHAYISTRDNNVEVNYGLSRPVSYFPAVEAANKAAAFRNSIVNYACKFIGNPYVWGGTSLTNGCDCSGFTQSVMAHFGIELPRVSKDQAKSGERIKSDKMKPGDLVFYANSSGTVNHVGIYIGNGQIVNAASRRSGIKILAWNYRTPVAIRNVIGP